MSFLQDIQGFSKSKLKPTDTVVKTTDGRTLLEVRDEAGTTVKVKNVGGLGFVGDYSPDLQLAPIMDGLFLGSQDVAADLDLMKSNGITHILNMAQNVDNFYPNYFTYHKFSLLDVPETNIATHFPEAFQFIDDGRQNGKVYVHCNAGVSRAATIVIAYYMKMNKVDFQAAYDHVKSVRPAVRPNDGFVKQLKIYRP